MKIRHVLMFSAGLLVSTHALADGATLARKSGCMACHAVDSRLVGPSFKEIAAKYKGDKEAAAKLAGKIRSGGSGSFGSTPMLPAPASVSDADIRTIVAWILSLS
ncbi:MAG TPA: c-type cytochrome [Gallionellaceae bacterium]|nr:c-type cytochrome [Gallionellaceae bacterium]